MSPSDISYNATVALSQGMNRANQFDITGINSYRVPPNGLDDFEGGGHVQSLLRRFIIIGNGFHNHVLMSSQTDPRAKRVRHLMFRIHPEIQHEYAPRDPCHVRILGDYRDRDASVFQLKFSLSLHIQELNVPQHS
uniref:Uncharacterized protein n=1 Tax=Psilocybe cubensis TaxID=181762 RepID=A0A8H7XZH2_PSICU